MGIHGILDHLRGTKPKNVSDIPDQRQGILFSSGSHDEVDTSTMIFIRKGSCTDARQGQHIGEGLQRPEELDHLCRQKDPEAMDRAVSACSCLLAAKMTGLCRTSVVPSCTL